MLVYVRSFWPNLLFAGEIGMDQLALPEPSIHICRKTKLGVSTANNRGELKLQKYMAVIVTDLRSVVAAFPGPQP